MAKRSKPQENKKIRKIPDAYIAGAGTVVEEKITDTLEKNYMPYAMSVIVSRAFPRSTASSPLTANCCILCTRWVCSQARVQSRLI